MHKKENQELVNKVADLEAKSQEYLSGWQRALADYENLKKESASSAKDLAEYAIANILYEVLPIYDHFKMALNHTPKEAQSADWFVGINHIKRQFEEFLKKYEVEEIATVGQKFNPEFHQAVSYEQSEKPDQEIIKELGSGYMVSGKVLKPAQVIVSKNSGAEAEDKEI